MNIHLSIHALRRARERFSQNQRLLQRLAIKALQTGWSARCAPHLAIREYLSNFSNPEFGHFAKIRGDQVYVFAVDVSLDIILLTTYQCPPEIRAITRKIMSRTHRWPAPVSSRQADVT
jgi:hypothetical protein